MEAAHAAIAYITDRIDVVVGVQWIAHSQKVYKRGQTRQPMSGQTLLRFSATIRDIHASKHYLPIPVGTTTVF